jgi:hypothetical protein
VVDYCPLCFEKAEFLHRCGELRATEEFEHARTLKLSNQRLMVMSAPLMGIALDFLLPLPSSLITSILLALIGSTSIGIIWMIINIERGRRFRLILRNVTSVIYTPKLHRLSSANGKSRVTVFWFGFLALSSAIQLFLFTPGNSSYFEYSINNKIERESDVDLRVECPGTQIYFYQDKIECRVNTGILGITVPARVSPSPLLGTFEVKVSLF